MIRKMAISIDASGDLVEKGPDGAPIAFRIWKGGKNDDDQGGTFLRRHAAAFGLGDEAAMGPTTKFQAFGLDHFFQQGVHEQLLAGAFFQLGLEGKAEFLEFADVQFLALAAAAVFGHGGLR